jgi:non-specific serine/threonine protein kinase
MQGDFAVAMARGEEGMTTYAAIPQGFSLHGPLWLLANAALARGENDRASAYFTRLLASGRAGGDEVSIANGLFGLGILAQRRGEMRQALTAFAESAAVCQRYGGIWPATFSLDGAAVAAAALGRAETAVRLFAAAEATRREVGARPVFAVLDGAEQQRVLAAARNSLTPQRFASFWAAGAALSLQAAVSEAQALLASEAADTGQSDGRSLNAARVRLTPREHEALRRLVDGQSDKEIATGMGLSRRTASRQVAAIRAKLGASSRAAVVSIALREHLL